MWSIVKWHLAKNETHYIQSFYFAASVTPYLFLDQTQKVHWAFEYFSKAGTFEKHDWRLQSESARMEALRLNDKAETEDF